MDSNASSKLNELSEQASQKKGTSQQYIAATQALHDDLLSYLSIKFANLLSEMTIMKTEIIDMKSELTHCKNQLSEAQKREKELLNKIVAMETISSPDIQTEENNNDFYIVGSSLLREVRENDIQNGAVKCIRGGKIDEVKKDIDEIQGSLKKKNIMTQIGGNDLEDENTTVEELTSQYEVLITEAKKKFPNSNIIISRLPPHFNKDTTRTKVKDFNESMKTWSNQNQITSVDNQILFEFKNGDVDLDSYVMSGDMPAIHLNRKGTNKLLDNLQKNIPGLILADKKQRQEPVDQPRRSNSK